MKKLIFTVVDQGDFMEVHEEFALNIIVGFGRMDGKTVGIIANQPLVLNGMIDSDAADKSAKFVSFCDAFNIPIVNFVDCPGYLGGKEQEQQGLIRHAARMIHAYCKATVPRVAVAIRYVYGAGISGMGMSKDLGTDMTFALPFAEIAVMKPAATVNVLFRSEIEGSNDPESVREKKIQEYQEKFANPYFAAERGWVDAVIEPREIRSTLIKALSELGGRRRKGHSGNRT
jgi:acetyl-CoA carboxylase carboxyltransferase component